LTYIELRTHSAFSFGDGTTTPEALVTRAAELGYPAIGLTDNADLGGAIRFALEAERQGVRPVVGAELIVDGFPMALLARDLTGYRNLSALVTLSRVGRLAGSVSDSVTDLPDNPLQPYPDAARGRVGEWATWENYVRGHGHPSAAPLYDGRGRDEEWWSRRGRGIPKDVSRTGSPTRPLAPSPRQGGRGGKVGQGQSAGTAEQSPGGWVREAAPGRGRAHLRFEDIEARSEGLYALTGPYTGEFATMIRTGRGAEAHYVLDRWRDVFAERLAMEVQLHHVSGEEAALAGSLIELAERTRVRWVISNDARYLDGAGRLVHDMLTALRAGVDVNTAASWGLLLPNGEWRLKSPYEMRVLWRGRERGLEAAKDIAFDCDFDLRWLRPPMPDFPVPPGHNDDSFLRELVYAGARTRWGQVDERQSGQLDHELGVIARLGFAGFFLVMWDAIRFAREHQILCQGRGSAANSAVAYCLGITAVDPVKHGLLFERFLSEVRTDGRTEAPDIDVDFEMHRREEVLDYMYERYRRQHAAITAVTQAFHAPTAIQDIMRALGFPAELAFSLSKRVHGLDPSNGAEVLEQGLAESCGLSLSDARGRALVACMKTLDNVPRLRSTHPGGFVLSCKPLGDCMPIEHTTMGRTILQFDKDDLDSAGVPKFDFLGLGGLSVIHLAFDAIEKRTGEKLEMYKLPTDDDATYEMISYGDTVGTFQIESRAQISSILQTKPDRLYDIVVQVALIRPGPIQARFVHPYTMRRRGMEPVRYSHPLLKPILARTYGIPIFQEQAMSVAMALGGFSAAEADELRRAMGHRRKLPKLHAALERLKQRCIQMGVEEHIATEVVEDLHSFANYGFPESHAWSFALIAYATAYLKAHYPAEFCLGLLNAWPMGFYPPATLVHDAIRHGVPVVGPCLRDGAWDCTLLYEPRPLSHPSPDTARGRVGDAAMAGSGDAAIAGQKSARSAMGMPATQDDLSREQESGTESVTRMISEDVASGVSPGSLLTPQQNTSPIADGPSPVQPIAAPPVQPIATSPVQPLAHSPTRPLAASGKGGESRGGENQGGERGDATRNEVGLRVGWRHIRGLGEKARQALQDARTAGPFTSINDVIRRAQLTRADALHLARAGAFEAFEPGRRKAAWEALRAAGDVLPLAPARMLPFDPKELEGEELIFLDYLATGISVNGHPMEHLRERLTAAGVTSTRDLKDVADGERVIVAGLVVARQHPETAKGTVFLLIEDEFGFYNVIVSRTMYEQNREVVRFASFLITEGRLEREDRVVNIIGRRFRELKAGRIAFQSHDFH
jgi:error-prone DNA polymerase